MLLGERKRYALENNGLGPHGLVVEEKDEWAVRLAIGVVKQAADDLRAAIRTNDEPAINELCRWFTSEWGQLLCFGYGRAIVSRIKKEEREREQNEA